MNHHNLEAVPSFSYKEKKKKRDARTSDFKVTLLVTHAPSRHACGEARRSRHVPVRERNVTLETGTFGTDLTDWLQRQPPTIKRP